MSKTTKKNIKNQWKSRKVMWYIEYHYNIYILQRTTQTDWITRQINCMKEKTNVIGHSDDLKHVDIETLEDWNKVNKTVTELKGDKTLTQLYISKSLTTYICEDIQRNAWGKLPQGDVKHRTTVDLRSTNEANFWKYPEPSHKHNRGEAIEEAHSTDFENEYEKYIEDCKLTTFQLFIFHAKGYKTFQNDNHHYSKSNFCRNCMN